MVTSKTPYCLSLCFKATYSGSKTTSSWYLYNCACFQDKRTIRGNTRKTCHSNESKEITYLVALRSSVFSLTQTAECYFTRPF